MAKTKISEYDSTANNNTDVASVNIDEGCAPSGINNAIRAVMAHLKDFQQGTNGDSFNGPHNGTVGATTPAAGTFTTLATTGNTTLGNDSGDVITINGSTSFGAGAGITGNLTLSSGTANGVAYLNGSKVLTSGSALTFDGTNLGVGTATPTAITGTARVLDVVGSSYGFGLFGNGTVTAQIAGDGANGLSLIGSRSNHPVSFLLNNAEQMRLTSTGLGIGTSSPVAKFQVVGASGAGIRVDQSNYNYYGAFGHVWMNSGFSSTFMTLDSSGNLGLGVTPSAWKSNYKALMVNTQGAAISGRSDNQSLNLSTNWYEDSGGADRYINSDFASRYLQLAGSHRWLTAPSGTAGNAISFTQAMTLDTDNSLRVGPSGSYNFWLQQGSSQNTFYSYNNGSDHVMAFRGSQYKWFIASGSTQAMTLDSSGNLLVGDTSTLGSARGYINAPSGSNGWTTKVQNNSNVLFNGYNSSGTQIFYVKGDGGIANYSANNTNLSDERTKTDIQEAGGYLSKICAIPVKTFKYKNQEDDELNLGVIAQDVEAVAPELVDVSGFGETPEDGIPLKAIYQTDLQYALMKCIQEQQAIINQLKARLDAANL